MTGFLVRRLLITVVLIWLVTTVVFMFVRLLPGDPASAILGASESFQPTEAALATVRQRLGLDRPLVEQYTTYLGGVGSDVANALTAAGTEDVYLTGKTASAAFPTTAGAAQL